jgi:hypothetical protein
MQDWLAAHLGNGLAAFRGARLSGTLVVHQDLLNEIVAEWFAAQSSGAAPAPAAAAAAAAPDGQLTGLVKTVTRVAVRADAGAVSVDFDIAV